jgi:hypothetical protein
MAEIVFHGEGDLVEVQAALSPRLLVERAGRYDAMKG